MTPPNILSTFFKKVSKIIDGGISALKANVCRNETPNLLTRSSPFIVMKLQKTFEAFKTRSPPPGVSNVLNVFFHFPICRTHHLPASQTTRTLYIIYNNINIYLQYIPLSHLCASQKLKKTLRRLRRLRRFPVSNVSTVFRSFTQAESVPVTNMGSLHFKCILHDGLCFLLFVFFYLKFC